MADILTQLQTCLDQLATQFYATLSYITTYHDHSPAIPPNVPDAVAQQDKIPKNAPIAKPSTPAAGAAPSGEAVATPGAAQGGSNGGGGGGGGAATPGAVGPQESGSTPPGPPRPDSPNTFQSRQRELARDLIIKEQQIEYLVSVLPGIESSEKQQEERIKQLAEELRVVEAQRRKKKREMAQLREKVDGLLSAVSRGTGISS